MKFLIFGVRISRNKFNMRDRLDYQPLFREMSPRGPERPAEIEPAIGHTAVKRKNPTQLPVFANSNFV